MKLSEKELQLLRIWYQELYRDESAIVQPTKNEKALFAKILHELHAQQRMQRNWLHRGWQRLFGKTPRP